MNNIEGWCVTYYEHKLRAVMPINASSVMEVITQYVQKSCKYECDKTKLVLRSKISDEELEDLRSTGIEVEISEDPIPVKG